MDSSSTFVGWMMSRRLAKIASIGVPPFMAVLVISSTALNVAGPRRRPNSSIPSRAERVESQSRRSSLDTRGKGEIEDGIGERVEGGVGGGARLKAAERQCKGANRPTAGAKVEK